jgi:hypothetical protein
MVILRMIFLNLHIYLLYIYLAVTEAKWWVHVLADEEDDYCMLLFPTDKLKKIARKYFSKAINGGDNDTSKFVLLPLKEIFNGETV